MTGVIFCGGKSSRMGSDKGLLEQENHTWAELTASKLIALKLPVVLSVNEQQYSLYKEKFEQLFIIKDNSSLDVYGPLKGILSVYLHIINQHLLVIACDMPAMQKEVIGHLIKRSSGKKKKLLFLKNNTYAEPLCAIYTSEGLKKYTGNINRDN
ncbi:MAG: molybdenum cofactor guanylyltransferase [Segetibacter sp.]